MIDNNKLISIISLIKSAQISLGIAEEMAKELNLPDFISGEISLAYKQINGLFTYSELGV